MPYLSDAAVRQIQEASHQLSGCHTEGDLETAGVDWLFDHVHADTAAMTELSPVRPARLLVAPSDIDAVAIGSAVADHFAARPVTDHPLVDHYYYRMRSITPLRISDRLSDREWRRTNGYNEVFKPFGSNYQMAIVHRRHSPVDNAGYTVMRSLRDFTDDELDFATGLQPVLYALHRAIGRPHTSLRGEAVEKFRLTPTEVEILALVAAGLTAVAIGHLRRVSPRTVRKHLENIYAKLGQHDRLQAVTYARTVGLLPPHAGSEAVDTVTGTADGRT